MESSDESKNIFRTIKSRNFGDINGKITLTTIWDTIPENSTSESRELTPGEVEWRWRFLTLPNNRVTVEISQLKYGKQRKYFNRKGKWVNRIVDPIYDQFVTKTYYYCA